MRIDDLIENLQRIQKEHPEALVFIEENSSLPNIIPVDLVKVDYEGDVLLSYL